MKTKKKTPLRSLESQQKKFELDPGLLDFVPYFYEEKKLDYCLGSCDPDTVFIPEGVTRINRDFFREYPTIKRLHIPASVEYIENNTFEGINFQTPLFIPPTVKRIGSGAFAETLMTTIYFGGDRIELGEEMFYHSRIYKITLPDHIVRLPKGIFEFCTFLKTVNLPKYLKVIEERAFQGCLELENIKLPDKVFEIGTRAFSGTYKLQKLRLPYSLNTIGAYAFQESGITNIRIPPKLKILPEALFSESSLKKVILPKKMKKINLSAFLSCSYTNKRIANIVKQHPECKFILDVSNIKYFKDLVPDWKTFLLEDIFEKLVENKYSAPRTLSRVASMIFPEKYCKIIDEHILKRYEDDYWTEEEKPYIMFNDYFSKNNSRSNDHDSFYHDYDKNCIVPEGRKLFYDLEKRYGKCYYEKCSWDELDDEDDEDDDCFSQY